MKPSQIVTLVFGILTTILAVVMKTTDLFPPVAIFWITIASTVMGIVNIQVFVPVFPKVLPPLLGKALSRLFSTLLLIFAVLQPVLALAPPGRVGPKAIEWVSFATMLISALAGMFFPDEKRIAQQQVTMTQKAIMPPSVKAVPPPLPPAA